VFNASQRFSGGGWLSRGEKLTMTSPLGLLNDKSRFRGIASMRDAGDGVDGAKLLLVKRSG
jgi:hypothetical protein